MLNIPLASPPSGPCNVSQWSQWSPCNVSCGPGYSFGNRSIVVNGTVCPPLERNRTCDNGPCASLSCSSGICKCVNSLSNSTFPSTQAVPAVPQVAGCGNASAFVVMMNWTHYCNDIQVCYGSCGLKSNKTLCDDVFIANLTASCANVPASEHSECTSLVGSFKANANSKTANADFVTLQQTNCACNSTSSVHPVASPIAWLNFFNAAVEDSQYL